MVRRTIPLKKEYLYRKNLEGKERLEGKEHLLYEKKRKIRQALEEGKSIPTELRNEEEALHRQIDLEDDHTAIPRPISDDEYAKATEREPKILITTSRDPSQPLSLQRLELKLVFLNAERMNRSGQVVYRSLDSSDVMEDSRIIGSCVHVQILIFTTDKHLRLLMRLLNLAVLVSLRMSSWFMSIVVYGLVISHLPFGPTAYFGLHNVVSSIMFVKKQGGPKSIELKEIGPRFELRLYQIKLGTVEQKEAQNEWVLRPYMKTTKKRRYLGD
ncbi:hypothetical protein Cgig2_026229 [Carnegiea gigantea]|uniref:Brix domain-containing protein n=1 Tax=Carnegiea gigantea TaxID=171969 RepID=A0A9Q1QIH4_9CARY|nr:hypothetical protein Cgig2_026229 [Carnegiea gigantea]